MKISKNLLLFNFIIINICSYEILFSNILIYESNVSAPLILLILGITIFLFIVIYPNIYHKLFNKIENNIILKIFFLLYLVIIITYSFSFVTFILKNWFYHKTPFIFILLFLLISVSIISKNKLFIIYNSFITGIILICFNLLPIFNSIPRNYSFINDLKLSFDYKYFFLLFTFVDSLILLFYSNNLNEKLSKKCILISFGLIIIFSFLMLVENYLFLIPDVFINTVNPGFLKYQIYFVNYLIDNIDVILIINIIFFCFSKLSIYLNMFKTLFNTRNKKTFNYLTNIVLFLLSLVFYSLIFTNKLILNDLSLPLTIILSLVFIISLFCKKEVNNEVL